MSIQYQNQNKINILITGGEGDLAKALIDRLSEDFSCSSPNRRELDVGDVKNVACFFEDKTFDIVINLAGTLYSSELVDSNPELWIKDIQVNLIGTYLVCRSALQKNKNTKIINVASTAAYNSYSDWTSYCAAKAGVIKISEGLSKSKFSVVTLCPGAVDTKIRDALTIENPNIMTIDEGVSPIFDAVNGKFEDSTIFMYRKGEYKFINGGFNDGI
ncbi:SDR family NAD(P)-dependent oxidoreductase [Vibrio cyclitrophicus]|uniref:SDR family NAD(P)-dependent oxidoreductase n=1 Tax=Vibrio sp. R78045 TaxID=3093868 RepID=UPI00355264FF